jgi:hypothetical protein
VRPQRDAFELSSAVRLLDLHAGGVVAVCNDHDTGVGAEVQIPELMTGGKRGDEQLRRIPSRRIAAEHRVGRAGYGCFALRADLVRTRIGAVRRPMDIPRDLRRAALPYSRVTLFNSSEVQTHIVKDRHSQFHTLLPGQRKHDIELTNEDISYFQRERSPDRFYPGTTTPKPLHPIIIEGVPSMVQAGGRYE